MSDGAADGPRAWRLADAAPVQAGAAPGEILGRLADGREWRGEAAPFAGALQSEPSEDRPVLIVLPTGPALPHERRLAVETWIAAGAAPGRAAVDVNLRARLLWTPGRLAIIGAADQIADAQAALLRFSWLEHQCARLEGELAALWPALEPDARLTHAVKRADLARQAYVNEKTMLVSAMRGRRIAAELMLGRPDGALSPAARRLLLELALQTNLGDRLDSLENPIEFAWDIYELANDRLTEYRYFSTEFIVEIAILVVLLAELFELTRTLFE